MPAAQGVLKWRPRAGAGDIGRRIFAARCRMRCRPHTADYALEMSDDPRGCARGVARVGAVGPMCGYSEPPACGRAPTPRLRSRPALFAFADHAIAAGRLVTPTAWARRCSCRRFGAAGSCAPPWRGSASAAALSLPFAGVHIVEAPSRVYRAIPAHRERTRSFRTAAGCWWPSPCNGMMQRHCSAETVMFAIARAFARPVGG